MNDTYSVEELLANPRIHAHSLVKVRGCFENGFEVSVLGQGPCDNRTGWPVGRQPLIWVEGANGYAQMKELRFRLRKRGKLNELKQLKMFGEEELLFVYDKDRDSQAWQKLLDSSSKGEQVLLLGQFETRDSGYGHMSSYKHELILIDVLSNNPTAAQ